VFGAMTSPPRTRSGAVPLSPRKERGGRDTAPERLARARRRIRGDAGTAPNLDPSRLPRIGVMPALHRSRIAQYRGDDGSAPNPLPGRRRNRPGSASAAVVGGSSTA
jgi:hypothetical protein